MSRRKSALLLSRGARLHHLFREMAADLARDHRVVVLAAPEEVPGFASLPGVEVRCYETPDVVPASGRAPATSIAELRAAAAGIEREIRLPLYKAAGSYLLYGRIVRSYGGRWHYLQTEGEILQAYVGAYRLLSEIFDQVAPDVVFYETIDLISSYVAFALAHARGVFGLEFRFSPLGQGSISPAFGIFRRNPVLEYLHAHREEIAPASYAQADAILATVGEHLRRAPHARLHRRMLRDAPTSPRRLLRALVDGEALVRGLRNARWHYRSLRNRLWLERNLSLDVPAPPYVVFFMKHLPEASTCSEAPRWVYQEAIVEQLAVNAPVGLRVVVKEHPRSYGRRGPRFFGPLRDLANVVLCHPAVDNEVLLRGAEAVVVVNGAVGLEGILLGARVGVLGRPFYSVYRGVRRLDFPEDIYPALRDGTWAPAEMTEERRDFLAAYVQSVHEFGHGTGTRIYPETGGARWAGALRATMEFIEARGLKPTDFEAGL